jgi:2-dehydropantoate 2-reductase
LTIRTPKETLKVEIPAVAHPSDITFTEEDVFLLAMQSQDSEDAQRTLFSIAGSDLPVVCAQNGVVNERLATRRFRNVYGMIVRLPSSLLEPGIVSNETDPGAGVLDIGCYPTGTDALASQMTSDFESAGFSSRVDPNIMRWKYAKLLFNLKNVYTAVFLPEEDLDDLAKAVREEALACYQAAGIEYASGQEMRDRALPYFKRTNIPGIKRPGTSTWQSLARGRKRVETDYLNGEIVLLGALHGVPTPYNRAVQIMANQIANGDFPIASMTRQDLDSYL